LKTSASGGPLRRAFENQSRALTGLKRTGLNLFDPKLRVRAAQARRIRRRSSPFTETVLSCVNARFLNDLNGFSKGIGG
jgi:hypothetical protein